MGKGARNRAIRRYSEQATVGRPASDTKKLARNVRKALKKRRRLPN